MDQARVRAAPVVDENGRCVGILTPTDVLRWVEAGRPEAVVGPVVTCPYQVCGRLFNGDEAVICTLAGGGCPFQTAQPTTGGRHTEICTRRGAESSPFGTLSCYMTKDVVTIRPSVPLRALVRQILDPRADHLVVLDELDRPIGLVSATEVLSAVAQQLTNEPGQQLCMPPCKRD
jgi:CBS domain-containing protein